MGNGESAPLSLAATRRRPAGGSPPGTEEETEALRGEAAMTEKPLAWGESAPLPHATPEPLRSGPAASRLAAWAWGLGWWSLEGPPELQLCPRCTHLWSCKRPLKEEGARPSGACATQMPSSPHADGNGLSQGHTDAGTCALSFATPAGGGRRGSEPRRPCATEGGCQWGAGSAPSAVQEQVP